METNRFSNNLFSNRSDSVKKRSSINENEDDLNNKYLKLELKQDENKSYNKEEKYKIFDNNHKQNIFNKNYGQKISLFKQANQVTSSKSKSKRYINENKNKNDLSLDQYIEELKKKYDENPLYYESMDKTTNKYYYRYSFCLFCHHLAFAYKDKVSCVNKCFIMDVKTNEFSEDYPLDFFLESLYDFHYFHMECNGDIIPLYINDKTKEPFFICNVCDKEIFEDVGIIL